MQKCILINMHNENKAFRTILSSVLRHTSYNQNAIEICNRRLTNEDTLYSSKIGITNVKHFNRNYKQWQHNNQEKDNTLVVPV